MAAAAAFAAALEADLEALAALEADADLAAAAALRAALEAALEADAALEAALAAALEAERFMVLAAERAMRFIDLAIFCVCVFFVLYYTSNKKKLFWVLRWSPFA